MELDARRQARLTGLPQQKSGAPSPKRTSAGVAGGAGGAGGGALAGGFSSMPRTVQEAEDMDFRGEGWSANEIKRVSVSEVML